MTLRKSGHLSTSLQVSIGLRVVCATPSSRDLCRRPRKLTAEQLANNRALVQQLKARTDNVKGQAVHVGAGFPLRRFNLDIGDGEFR